MFYKFLSSAARTLYSSPVVSSPVVKYSCYLHTLQKSAFSHQVLSNRIPSLIQTDNYCSPVVPVTHLLTPLPSLVQHVKTLTKFSLQKGTRKSVKAVLKRFYRLDWGIWIHTKCGRHKKMWKKSSARRRRLRQHVFCNATQSSLLDKMVTKVWKRPRYFVDNPYAPYHSREEFPLSRRKPAPLPQ